MQNSLIRLFDAGLPEIAAPNIPTNCLMGSSTTCRSGVQAARVIAKFWQGLRAICICWQWSTGGELSSNLGNRLDGVILAVSVGHNEGLASSSAFEDK